jgi:pimeloyl-ACP methyl ester carboxylesterase
MSKLLRRSPLPANPALAHIESLRRGSFFTTGMGLLFFLAASGLWVYANRYAGFGGFFQTIPELVSMLGVPITILIAGISGLLSLRLHRISEEAARPITKIYAQEQLLSEGVDILRDRLAAEGTAGPLIVSLPALAYESSNAANKNLAEEFYALLKAVLREQGEERPIFATESPLPAADGGPSPVFARLGGDRQLYRRSIERVLDLLETATEQSPKIIFARHLRATGVIQSGARCRGVMSTNDDTHGVRGFSTTNPAGCELLAAMATSTVDVDLDLSICSPAILQLLKERIAEHLAFLYREPSNTSEVAVHARRCFNIMPALLLPKPWLEAQGSDSGQVRKFRWAGLSPGSNLVTVVLPSFGGFTPRTRDFYDAIIAARRADGDVVAIDYPGTSGRGEFSIDAAVQVLTALLGEYSGKRIALFGTCTGFLVALHALLRVPNANVVAACGWHVPKVMDFTAERVSRFQSQYGARIAADFVRRYDVVALTDDVRKQFPKSRMSVLRGLTVLADEPSVEYMEINAPAQPLRSSTHIPLPDSAMFSDIVRCVVYLLEEQASVQSSAVIPVAQPKPAASSVVA